MKFHSLRVPQRYLSDALDVSVYVPFAESQDQYDAWRKQVDHNRVHSFTPRPVV